MKKREEEARGNGCRRDGVKKRFSGGRKKVPLSPIYLYIKKKRGPGVCVYMCVCIGEISSRPVRVFFFSLYDLVVARALFSVAGGAARDDVITFARRRRLRFFFSLSLARARGFAFEF